MKFPLSKCISNPKYYFYKGFIQLEWTKAFSTLWEVYLRWDIKLKINAIEEIQHSIKKDNIEIVDCIGCFRCQRRCP